MRAELHGANHAMWRRLGLLLALCTARVAALPACGAAPRGGPAPPVVIGVDGFFLSQVSAAAAVALSTAMRYPAIACGLSGAAQARALVGNGSVTAAFGGWGAAWAGASAQDLGDLFGSPVVSNASRACMCCAHLPNLMGMVGLV